MSALFAGKHGVIRRASCGSMRRCYGSRLALAALLALVAFSSPGWADSDADHDAAMAESVLSSTPEVIADSTAYVVDPGFHGGEYIEDAFYANQNNATNYFLGRKVARLANGEIVVAALVKNPNGNQSNGYWNIGLVKYDAGGTQRRTWFNAGPYAWAGGEYIVYPKSNTANYSWIQDIKVIGNFIVVSTNLNFGGSASDVDTYLLVFDTDGVLRSSTAVFAHDTGAEYIGGMEVYSTGTLGSLTHKVVVVGTRGGSPARPIFQRLTLNSNGTLSADTGVVALNAAGCANVSNECQAKGIALGYGSLATTAAPALFVANLYRSGGASGEAQIAVMKLKSDGSADPDWAATIWNTSPGGARADVPFGIAVNSTGLGLPGSPRVHTLYVGAYIDRACRSGMSVMRQSTADNGATAVARQFGGSDESGISCTLFGAQDVGGGLTLQDGKLAIVGMRVSFPLCEPGNPCEPRVDAELAILDDLSLQSFSTFPFPIHGARDRHTGLYGVIGSGNGKFVAVGDNRFRNGNDVPATLRGKQSVAIIGFAPDDRIFVHGFE